MARDVFYRQCRLVKRTQSGELQQVSWIPDKFAVVGMVLKLRAEDKTWDNGWIVKFAGLNRLSSDQVPDYHELRPTVLMGCFMADLLRCQVVRFRKTCNHDANA